MKKQLVEGQVVIWKRKRGLVKGGTFAGTIYKIIDGEAMVHLHDGGKVLCTLDKLKPLTKKYEIYTKRKYEVLKERYRDITNIEGKLQICYNNIDIDIVFDEETGILNFLESSTGEVLYAFNDLGDDVYISTWANCFHEEY